VNDVSGQFASSFEWKSYHWKTDLQLHAERVEAHLNEALNDEFDKEHHPLHMLERALVLSAFCIRRMVEKKVVTDQLAASKISVRTFLSSPTYRPPLFSTSGTNYTVFSNYVLEKSVFEDIKVGDIANEIIHSSQLLVFNGAGSEPKSGLLIASDFRMRRRLLHFTAPEFRSWVNSVLDDRVGMSTDRWDPETGKVFATREALKLKT
jgi:hypothetical protein